MNTDIIKGNWEEAKGKIRQHWGKLTNDQVETMKGSYQELEGLLQKAYGYERDEADKQIDQFIRDNRWH